MSRITGTDTYLHVQAAIGEGLCPRCHGPLNPVGCPPGWTAGHCAPCGSYWHCNVIEAAWTRDFNPVTLQPVIPSWVQP